MVVYRYGTYASSISNHDFVAVRRFYIYGVCLSVFSVIHYVLLHGLAIQLDLDLDMCTVHIGAGINMATSIANLAKQSYMFLSATHCLMDKGTERKREKHCFCFLLTV